MLISRRAQAPAGNPSSECAFIKKWLRHHSHTIKTPPFKVYDSTFDLFAMLCNHHHYHSRTFSSKLLLQAKVSYPLVYSKQQSLALLALVPIVPGSKNIGFENPIPWTSHIPFSHFQYVELRGYLCSLIHVGCFVDFTISVHKYWIKCQTEAHLLDTWHGPSRSRTDIEWVRLI